MRAQRGLIVIVMVLMGLVFTASAALAQAYPPGASAQCPTSAPEPGDSVTCSADGFAPGSEVDVEVRGTAWSRDFTVTASSEGVASVTFQVPADANDGEATITFTGPDASSDFTRVASATFTVQEEAAGEGPIPATGADVSNGAILALGGIVLGGALVYGSRRRRKGEIQLEA